MPSRMTLKDILESKPTEVITVNKKRSIVDAIKTMRERNVSGVFVVDKNNKLVGIFTERDVVHCYVKGCSFEKDKIESVMRTDLITFDPSTKISTAISIAAKNKKRHLPVVEGDRIVGMITFRDLVSYLLPEICYMAEEIY
ncbi:MAG: CBS domain-containing protein [Nitrospirota bacterium]